MNDSEKLTCWSCAKWQSAFDKRRFCAVIMCAERVRGFPNRTNQDCGRFEYEPGTDESERQEAPEASDGPEALR